VEASLFARGRQKWKTAPHSGLHECTFNFARRSIGPWSNTAAIGHQRLDPIFIEKQDDDMIAELAEALVDVWQRLDLPFLHQVQAAA
jgi:hypothetical protein